MSHFSSIRKEVSKISRQYRSMNEAMIKVTKYNRRIYFHALSAHFVRKDAEKAMKREKRRILKNHSS
ncbi:hypothetical protein F4X10_17750 [Candidatus Poribacteria bacterium]|nr:hypothetical protein [Candidatus Poribacteria bacterium]